MSEPLDAARGRAVRADVLVTGRVQGVGYRYSCMQAAKSIGVTGWVCNLPDGCVEAAFEGDRASVEKAIEWCRGGPPGAGVTNVAVNWETPRGEKDFRITH